MGGRCAPRGRRGATCEWVRRASSSRHVASRPLGTPSWDGGAGGGDLSMPRPQRSTTTTGRPWGGPCDVEKTGGVLLSQALASQVPSALRGLTSLFGMGRGVSPSPRPPEKVERPRLRVLQNCTAPQRVSLRFLHWERIKKIRQALDPLVPVSFRRHRPSRSGLSTWWSTRGLTPSRGWESSSRGRLPA